MDDKYREHIKKNVERLIRLTTYEKLLNACVQSGILTNVMSQDIENISHFDCENMSPEEVQHERHRRLFLKLTRRGPDAYQRLKTVLVMLKCDAAVKLLDEPRNDDSQFVSLNKRDRKNDKNSDTTDKVPNYPAETNYDNRLNKTRNDSGVELELYTKKIQPKILHDVKKSTRVHIDSKVGIYPMKTQHNRGVFFMVNIIDFPNEKDRRNGSEEDGESLLYLFKELGFKLFAYENLTQSQFFKLLDAVIDSKYVGEAECFVMALMTHGRMDDNMSERVEFHDGSVIKVRDIEDRFENRRCPHLVHKPKIFIFPFCRGDIADDGFYRTVQTDGISKNPVRMINVNMPSLSDVFICYASMRGYKSHRDTLDGSWYIQMFVELMAKNAHDTDFEDIVKMIQRETGKLRTSLGAMQTGSYTNIGFNNKLYFNPGAWEN